MILDSGEKIHVIIRQLYDTDAKRHFVGVVESCEGTLARAKGYILALETKSNQFIKHGTVRTRIIPLGCEGIIVNVLPDTVEIEKIAYKYQPGRDTLVTDGSEWHLDLTHL